MSDERQREIHNKGFNMLQSSLPDNAPSSASKYVKLKIGKRSYTDAILDLQHYDKMDKRYFRNKDFIMQALMDNNVPLLRAISRYYYKHSNLHNRHNRFGFRI